MLTPHDVLRNLFSKSTSLRIIECGAYRGEDTLVMLRYLGGRGDVTISAYEPDPRNFPYLKRVEGPYEDGLLVAHQFAIGGACGISTLYGSTGDVVGVTGWSKSSSMREPTGHLKEHPWCTFPLRIKVRCTTLDTEEELYSFLPLDLIWCDIQGCEKDMIEGGTITLGKTRYVLLETDKTEMYAGQATKDVLIKMMRDRDFAIHTDFGSDVLFCNTILCPQFRYLLENAPKC